MSRVKTAIIGCGKVAHLHAAALQTLPESEFVAACDNARARARTFAQQYGVTEWDDPVRMVQSSRAEAVVICTPHPLHAAPAIAVMNAGAHVLVEKPLATTVADCDAMIAAARLNKVRLGVVSQRRFFEPVLRMKAAIDAGNDRSPCPGNRLDVQLAR